MDFLGLIDAERGSAWATIRMRSGVGVPSRPANRGLVHRPAGRLVHQHLVQAGQAGLHGAEALLQDLLAKLRPIAMASPTDFIAVVSIASAPGNFSKVKRGILVTT